MISIRSNVARGLGQKQWMFAAAVTTVLAAVGCSDDAATVPGGVGMAGTGVAGMAPAAGTTGTGAAGMATGAAGTVATAAGTGATTAGTGAVTAGTGGAVTAGTGAATAGTGAATAGTGAATAGTGAATAGTGAATAGTGASGAAPTLQMVWEMVIVNQCAVCHGMAPKDSANGNLGNVKGGKDAFYNAVVNKPAQGSQCMGKGMYVVPGNPAMSLLLQKVSSTPPCGVEMPVGGMLEPDQVKLITDWIAAGAMNN